MRKASAAPATFVFFFLAPGVVAGFVPWRITHWTFHPSWWDPRALRWLGAALIAMGMIALLECFVRFAVRGRGTPAPMMPTEVLVVSGLYRYVRNPMYVAVFAIVLGQAVLFASGATAVYAACLWIAFTLFVLLYEEPTLRRRYGAQYESYCRQVRRWIPRLTPWHGQ
jgi:protein-S-isoprenylcysteine O-methyltransferase Ste14